MTNREIAQVNIAPIDSKIMIDFVNYLDVINAIEEQSEVFVWNLWGEENDATAIRIFKDDFLIIKMSICESKNMLFDFTHTSDYVAIFARTKERFNTFWNMHFTLWFVENGHKAYARLGQTALKLSQYSWWNSLSLQFQIEIYG
ncbi:hypothetical protein LCGC14_1517270 [marine sediment metagenome]|uniref:DUF3291 domain-containing protein n=1 Tax=marine sediment metagenome TaxID=412755 RepID=A0A0F9IZX4_9ZZZZ